MSMFHELMMRKKEQIMYATIKGSLTENDGVFSGFSASNYLLTQDKIIPKKDLTISISLTTNNISSQCFFSSGVANHRYLACTIEGGRFLGYGYSVNGTGWEGGYKTTTYELESNTKYNIVFEITKNYVKVKIKKASETTFTEFTNTVSDYIHDVGSPLSLAKDFNNTKYFEGSIDLNNSYIKLGSTKYNLQAVVGYTVVGSPTITDGVVSGFSGSNYLALPTINISEGTPFNIITKISTPADYQGNWLLAFVTSSSRIYCLSQVPVFRYLSNGTATNLSFNYTMIFNTTYILEVKYDGNKLKVIIYDENKNILSSNEVEDTKVVFFNGSYTIGSNRSNQFFNGSIDMNTTNIKIENKLWFNGQQA